MGHYETFVIRLWMEDCAALGHGEIRHLPSGNGVRFRQLGKAVKFIERLLEGQAPQAEKTPREAARSR